MYSICRNAIDRFKSLFIIVVCEKGRKSTNYETTRSYSQKRYFERGFVWLLNKKYAPIAHIIYTVHAYRFEQKSGGKFPLATVLLSKCVFVYVKLSLSWESLNSTLYNYGEHKSSDGWPSWWRTVDINYECTLCNLFYRYVSLTCTTLIDTELLNL